MERKAVIAFGSGWHPTAIIMALLTQQAQDKCLWHQMVTSNSHIMLRASMALEEREPEAIHIIMLYLPT